MIDLIVAAGANIADAHKLAIDDYVGWTIEKYEAPSITPPLSTAFPYEDCRLLILARMHERELKHEAEAQFYSYDILAQTKADSTSDRHNVYVIELSRSVLPGSKALFVGFPSMLCVYVGLTGLSPEQRIEKHKSGHKSNRNVY